MSKLKVSIDPHEIWDREDFRIFSGFLSVDETVELYIVTQSTDSTFINRIATELDIHVSRVVFSTDINDKVADLEELGIDVHFDYLQSNVLEIIQETEVEAILVNHIEDTYTKRMKYVQKYENYLQANKLIDGENC